MEYFRKGIFNTLIAIAIGEEVIHIGKVNIVFC
jgi:ERCC4-related helicase